MRILGYKQEDLIGKSSLNFIHPDDLKLANESLKSGFETGSESAEFRFKKRMENTCGLKAQEELS